FPGLNMAFLEGGAGWACLLYGDLLGHWEKRSLKGLQEVDPRNIDSAVLLDLAEKYGGEAFTAVLKRQGGQFFPGEEKLTGGIANLDDYSARKSASVTLGMPPGRALRTRSLLAGSLVSPRRPGSYVRTYDV